MDRLKDNSVAKELIENGIKVTLHGQFNEYFHITGKSNIACTEIAINASIKLLWLVLLYY